MAEKSRHFVSLGFSLLPRAITPERREFPRTLVLTRSALTLDNLAVKEEGYDLQAWRDYAEVCFGIGVHKGRTSVSEFHVIDGAEVAKRKRRERGHS